MKTRNKVIAFCLTFLVGIGVGVAGYRVHLLSVAGAEAKTDWMLCTMAHKGAIEERAKSYHEKAGRWPTNVQEMVEARLLPEWSEVHFCPAAAGKSALSRDGYEGSAFVDDNETALVARFSCSPYRFVIQNDKFAVLCNFEKRHNR
jgi:hypothetical protein